MEIGHWNADLFGPGWIFWRTLGDLNMTFFPLSDEIFRRWLVFSWLLLRPRNPFKTHPPNTFKKTLCNLYSSRGLCRSFRGILFRDDETEGHPFRKFHSLRILGWLGLTSSSPRTCTTATGKAGGTSLGIFLHAGAELPSMISPFHFCFCCAVGLWVAQVHQTFGRHPTHRLTSFWVRFVWCKKSCRLHWPLVHDFAASRC